MIDEKLMQNFGLVWPQHVMSLTQFLIDCRRHFDGDIDLFLVLCVIGDRSFSARHAPADIDFENWSSTSVEDIRSEEINVQSISDFSGIPRETVRRKLNILIEKAWMDRDERGYITATDKAKEDLAPLTVSSLVYLTRMKATLSFLSGLAGAASPAALTTRREIRDMWHADQSEVRPGSPSLFRRSRVDVVREIKAEAAVRSTAAQFLGAADPQESLSAKPARPLRPP